MEAAIKRRYNPPLLPTKGFGRTPAAVSWQLNSYLFRPITAEFSRFAALPSRPDLLYRLDG
jgi:hypothetical protein